MLIKVWFQIKFLAHHFFSTLTDVFVCAVFCAAILLPKNSYAIFEGVRSDIGYGGNVCDTGHIGYDPLFEDNKDLNWDTSNKYCQAFIGTIGAAMVVAGKATDYACIPTNVLGLEKLPYETAQNAIPESPTITPATQAKIAARLAKCASRNVELATLVSLQSTTCANLSTVGLCATYTAEVAKATTDASKCCPAYYSYLAITGSALTWLAAVYGVAYQVYESAGICGKDWNMWTKDSDGDWTKGVGTYQTCLKYLFIEKDETSYNSNGCSSLLGKSYSGASDSSITNKYYREFVYGGIEYEDEQGCGVPSSWSKNTRNRLLGYDDSNQRYYMTGPASTPVYACYRFLLNSQTDEKALAAYNCCKQRSQKAVCVEIRDNPTVVNGHVFCEIGSKCGIGSSSVSIEAYASKKVSNYACAKTYSVCPYNHLIGGGTEIAEYSSVDSSQVVNFCQYMNHCSKIPVLPYVSTSTLESEFISSACYDMKGDSQNVYGYTSQLIPINTRGFSAPLVQCFKETMENVFFHKAGRTICSDPNEFPDSDGVCASGDYKYQEGDDLPGDSFFTQVQDRLQSAVKMVLTLSILFFGTKILLGMQVPDKKMLLPYILKIALVLYFATGDAWNFGFMKGVIGTSGQMAEITLQIDEDKDSEYLDGCQFPRYNYADSTDFDNPSYAASQQYLRIWDTLDCKIARALGFGPEVSVPNLIFMILGGFLTGGLGIVFVVASFCFAFFLISITVRAMHIFLISMTAVIILIYVSPLIIPMTLFERTKSIFTGWLKRMLSFTFQPMILFLYLGILITLFDKVLIGEATFSGDGLTSPKTIVCSGDAKDTSIYCIFRVADIKTLPGFEVLGVGLPALTSMNQEKLKTIIKAAILMFIFVSFLDKITKLAAEMLFDVGELSSNWKLSANMAKSAYGTLSAIQKRGMRSIQKHGKSAADATKSVVRDLASQGKSISPTLKGGIDPANTNSKQNAIDSPANTSDPEQNPIDSPANTESSQSSDPEQNEIDDGRPNSEQNKQS